MATVAIEYWLSFAFYFKRQRPYAIVTGILLHLAFFQILRVSTFSATMVVAYLAYIPPGTVHRFIDELLQSSHSNESGTPGTPNT